MDRATLVGMSAIVVWSLMTGLLRWVTEGFPSVLATALVYTLAAIILLIARRPAPFKSYSKRYLLVSGLLFATYETIYSVAIVISASSTQAIEVSLVNYFWPSLTVLFAAVATKRGGNVMRVLPGVAIATIGIVVAVAGNSGIDAASMAQSAARNPLPYLLALAGAVIWAIYSVITPKLSQGKDATSLFFPLVAGMLWVVCLIAEHQPPAAAPPAHAIAALVGAAVVIGSGYVLWNHGLAHGNMRTMATISFFAPILSVISSSLMLGVQLAPIFWVGTIAVVTGSLINWKLDQSSAD